MIAKGTAPGQIASHAPTISPLAQSMTLAIVLLAAVSSAGGLFIQGLYRDPAAIVPVLKGQDLVTLLALPAVLVALAFARRGSLRGALVLLGLLGYLCYTYIGAAFGYHYNSLFLVYVALFSLTVFALVTIAAGLDVAEVRSRFDNQTPRGPVIAFLLLTAFMLLPIELGENAKYLLTGTPPLIIQRSGGVTCFVYALDLGIIVPLVVLAAVWLWRRQFWGYVLSGCMLIKAATMGLALISMNLFSVLAGMEADGLLLVWAVIAGGGLGLSAWFFRHCRG